MYLSATNINHFSLKNKKNIRFLRIIQIVSYSSFARSF